MRRLTCFIPFLLATAVAPAALASASPAGCSAVFLPATGSLSVQVLSRDVGGAAPSSVFAPPAPADRPFSGVSVRVRPADTGDLTEVAGTTDEQGLAVFDLFPGDYWLYAPQDAPAYGSPTSGAITTALPDGTLAYAWTGVSVASGECTSASLTIIFPQP